MTAKEKARELVDNYKGIIDHQDHYWGVDQEAKQCALIAVDEILKSFDDCYCKPILKGTFAVKEWLQVRKEIEKL